MTTQYTPILKLALPVTGELSGSWGDTVNDNITSMVEQAVAGLATINTWTTNSHTLTTANGVSSESRCAMLVAATGGGAPTAAATIICPAASKLYILQNNTSYVVTLKTASGTGVAVAAGNTSFLFCDGTNVNPCVTSIVDGVVTGNLTVDGNATVKGNTTLGDATTDTVTVNGYMGVGGAGTANIGVRIVSTALTGATQVGAYSTFTASSAATASVWGFLTAPATAATAFTATNMAGYSASDVTKGAGSTITNQHGVYISDQTQGTNNYGITSLVSSGSNKWNIYASGTAANYFAGVVQLGDGTAAAPALSNFGDENTGIFFPAADTIAFTEGGVESMRIDSSGNVGIGNTPSGTYKLEVTGGFSATGNAVLGDASTDTVTVNGYMGVGAAANAAYNIFATGSSTAGANQYSLGTTAVLSGTTFSASFLAGHTLAASIANTNTAGLRVLNTALGSGATITSQHGVYIADLTSGTNNYGVTSLVSSGTNKFNIYASGTADNYFAGNVGIGLSTPYVKLQVDGNVRIGDTDVGVDDNEEYSITSGGQLVIHANDSAADVSFNTLSLRSGASGGAAASSSTVDVVLNGTQVFAAKATEAVFNDPGNDYDFRVESDTNTHALFVQGSDGFVGIGTSSPQNVLHVSAADATLRLTTTSDTGEAGIELWDNQSGTSQTAAIRFNDTDNLFTIQGNSNGTIFLTPSNTFPSASEAMRIDSAGDVGIGTTSPSRKLHVVGNNAVAFLADSGTDNTIAIFQSSNAQANLDITGSGARFRIGASGTGEFFLSTGTTSTYTERMRIDSSGNVGIGTSLPGQPLVVSKNYNGATWAQVSNTTSGTGASSGLLMTSDASIQGSIELTSSTYASYPNILRIRQIGAYPIGFFTNDTERMRIDSAGNVGIGVTPSASWASSFGVIQGLNQYSISTDGSSSNTFSLASNAVRTASGSPGSWNYLATAQATIYQQRSGAHSWFNAPSGTAGASAAVTSGQVYTVTVLGSSTLAQWQAFFSALTVLPVLGQTITATATGSIVGGGTVTQSITFTQAMTLDASGRLLVGYTSNIGITDALLQVSDTTDKQAIFSRFSNNSSSSTLIFAKSRSGTLGTNTVLTNGDGIGTIQFRGADGTNYIQAASITAAVDGTPGTNDMPGRLVFSTTADGASSPTERMRIDSSGNVLIGATAARALLAGTITPISQVEGTTSNTSISIIRNANTAGSEGILFLGKSRGTVLGSVTTVVANDYLGEINFQGADGTNMVQAAAIIGQAEGTISTGTVPGRLSLLTTNSSGTITERMRIDSAGNVQVQTGAVMPYAPAPAPISAAATLTNANIQAQIISATGTTYTITMPLGTTLETLATWATTGIGYDFYIINAASGTITLDATEVGVTSVGTMTIATGVSAQFRIRRTAANTFVVYRLG